ncbi:hypothetical protein PG985_013095 [Apiospora marii]|uniref:Uncharacterized protein n=1 Tax=Apiospora marii TaxID=335849 RepID=A0ABR1RBQ9_9PEZI
MTTLNRNQFTIEVFPSCTSEATSSIASPSDLGRGQRWSSHSEVSSLHSSHSSHPEQDQDRPVSPPSCHSRFPPSYTPPINSNIPTAVADAAAGHVAERPVAIPQQRPTATAPFFPAYAPSLRNHGITPAAWRQFVASMNEAILTSAPVSDQARSISRRIRAASGGMWSAIVTSSASLVPSSNNNTANNSNPVASGGSDDNSNSTTKTGTGNGRISPPISPMSGPCRTLREERIIAAIAAANIAWFHPQGLHVAMMDTTVLAGKLAGNGSGDARGILPSRLMETARPRRDEGPLTQLAALRPWIAELEAESDTPAADADKTLLELAPDSLWLVVTRRTGAEKAAGI